MDSAARLPAATACMTEAGPVTLSPPANTPLVDVSNVTGSTLKQPRSMSMPQVSVNCLSSDCPMAMMTWSACSVGKYLFVIGRAEAPVFIKYAGAAFQLDPRRRSRCPVCAEDPSRW